MAAQAGRRGTGLARRRGAAKVSGCTNVKGRCFQRPKGRPNLFGLLDARLPDRASDQAFALGPLAGQLAGAADGFRSFTRTLFGGLFEIRPALHFAESAFPLHLLFERLQRLIDVVFTDENLNQDESSFLRRRENAPFRAPLNS